MPVPMPTSYDEMWCQHKLREWAEKGLVPYDWSILGI